MSLDRPPGTGFARDFAAASSPSSTLKYSLCGIVSDQRGAGVNPRYARDLSEAPFIGGAFAFLALVT